MERITIRILGGHDDGAERSFLLLLKDLASGIDPILCVEFQQTGKFLLFLTHTPVIERLEGLPPNQKDYRRLWSLHLAIVRNLTSFSTRETAYEGYLNAIFVGYPHQGDLQDDRSDEVDSTDFTNTKELYQEY